MVSKSWSTAALVFALAVGCEAEEGDSAPPEVTLEEAPAALETAWCARIFECECVTGRWYSTVEQCEQDVARRVLDAGSSGDFDSACMGRFVAQLDELGCDAVAGAFDHCDLVNGGQVQGEPCMKNRLWSSECGLGLVCNHEYECVPQGSEAAAAPGEGESCSDEHPCTPGLVCSPGAIWTCEALAKLGEDCSTRSCEAGTTCGPVEPDDPLSPVRCQALTETGQMCFGHAECASGYCPNGFCAAVPTEGESCAGTGVCDEGLSCFGDVCVAGDAAVCRMQLPRF